MRWPGSTSAWGVGAVGLMAWMAISGGPSPAAAQSMEPLEIQVDTGVDPDTVTVGQPFRSAIRVGLPEGFRVEFEALLQGDSVEAPTPPQVLDQAGGSGAAAVYEIVAWFTGDSLTATVPVRVVAPDGAITEHVLPLAMPVVASVLPAAGEEVAPRPLKGLVVPPSTSSPFPWWWLLLAAVIAAALIYVWWRSRRSVEDGAIQDPRVWALGELDALLASVGEGADPVEQYRQGSWVLREYLARINDGLGTDLTTWEVVRRARAAGMQEGTAKSLISILESADRVKFSADHPATDAAAREALIETRELVNEYPSPVGADAGRRAA